LQKCRAVVTGGAPCPSYIAEFIKVLTGGIICQGYGLTETAAASCFQDPGDNNCGHVGSPSLYSEIRVKSVDEMGYFVTDNPPRGEIQLRGPLVFAGYYKNEEATKESFDKDWFCSGDIGRLNPNGTLSIIDRKKNIFKLAHGEYIAVERVENVYAECPLIGQIWVYGNSYKPMLVAIVVPNGESIEHIAKGKGLWKSEAKLATPEWIAEFQRVWNENREFFENTFKDTVKKQESSLKGFEKVAKYHFELNLDRSMQGFTIENNTLTPSMKLRRPNLLSRYLDTVKQMYTDLGEPPKVEERWK